jgi:CheY-like chemotaxis protein
MILVVEDDQTIQSLIEEVLSDGGFESSIAASGFPFAWQVLFVFGCLVGAWMRASMRKPSPSNT